MDEILKQYMVLYKKMSNMINGPDSVIKCAYGDMTLEDLEAVYYGLTTPFF
ncbi:YnfE family protein [Bacillus subtilis]